MQAALNQNWQKVVSFRQYLADRFVQELGELDGIDIFHQVPGIVGLEGKALNSFDPVGIGQKCWESAGWDIKGLERCEWPKPVLRVSFSLNNTEEETLKMAKYIKKIIKKRNAI